MRLLFTFLLFSAFAQAQHHFSLQSGNVIWERHFSTPEKNVLEQLRKTHKLHFLTETSGNGLNLAYPCKMLFGIDAYFDFRFTVVARDGSYLVSIQNIRFEDTEDPTLDRSFDPMVKRFNGKELSKSKGAQATMKCMDDYLTSLFKTREAVPQ